MQLVWATEVCRHTGGDVLIFCPLAVAHQTRDEAWNKLGLVITVCRTQADVEPGVNITNYEMLSHFDAAHFSGVVLDESSVLKNYTGKVKQDLIDIFSQTPYRLCCPATPAPNDHMELGNHAEFLGIMPSNEMLMRWFINDTMQMGHYRLKGHAETDFWNWVATWAITIEKPSDLGYSDDGFLLPPLSIRHEVVEVDRTIDRGNQLIRTPTMSATTMHKEMRLTAAARATCVANTVNASTEAWAVWCNTNYEADELKKRIPDAIEVRGSETPATKERKLKQFSDGKARVIISKPSVAGYGLNWQHCHHAAFIGLSFSFEDFYQAIGRFHRYGQAHPVEIVVVAAETEGEVLATVQRKMALFAEMRRQMVKSVNKLALTGDLALTKYLPQHPIQLPTWLKGRVA